MDEEMFEFANASTNCFHQLSHDVNNKINLSISNQALSISQTHN